MSEAARSLKPALARVAAGARLSQDEAREAVDVIMAGEATPAQIGAFLMGLRVRGETVDEIAGAAQAMRSRMHAMRAPAGAMDVVGTGGDGKGTLNVSTATALVVAGCGVTIAKHGNRAMSSKAGTADTLAALGVNLDADYPLVQRAIDEGIGFMLAPRHHAAMRHVGPVRVEMGVRTLFNLLGPICNPAGVRHLLVGVFAADWVVPVAEVLGRLGAERAWVVHSSDGCDELTLAGPNRVAELKDGKVRAFALAPSDAGLAPLAPDAIPGADAAHNAAAIRALLDGAPGPFRETVLFNAAAALVVAGRAPDLKAGVAQAAAALAAGAPKARLARLAAITQGQA